MSEQTRRLPALCRNCCERPATKKWGDALALSRGVAEWWCEICVIETQIAHAKERAAALPVMEIRLQELRAKENT